MLTKIGQYALVENDEGEVLILLRSRSRTWSLPGGRLEEGEKWDESLLRELKEETNLNCENPVPFSINILKDPYQTKYCVYFKVRVLNLKEIKISEEHGDYKWIGLKELNSLNMEDKKIVDVIASFMKEKHRLED